MVARWSALHPGECALSSEVDPKPEEIPDDWPRNYFNYFTEVEDHFQRARGTGLFLLSPLDWALIDNWRTAGIPLKAVLKGIDEAFVKWHSRKQKRRMVNSLAYCAQAVLECAQRVPDRRGPGASESETPLFESQQIATHLLQAAAVLRSHPEPPLVEVAQTLETLAADSATHLLELESLEQKLSALEEKVVAVLRASQSDETLFSIRQALDAELRPYRNKMTADQLALLERRYLDTALLGRAGIPRLSLFYLH